MKLQVHVLLIMGLMMGGTLFPVVPDAKAQGIELLLSDTLVIPKRRPDRTRTSAIAGIGIQRKIVAGAGVNAVTPLPGTLVDGMNHLGRGDVEKSLAIRAGMRPGSLDRKILAWAIAISGKAGTRSATIASIASDLKSWPGQAVMRRNAERAFVTETAKAPTLIAAFGNQKPETVEGAIALSRALMSVGKRKQAYSVIAPFWHENILTKPIEDKILKRLGGLLGKQDHQRRMHMLFYRDRVKAAMRLAGRSEQYSLAKARAASIRESRNAKNLIERVAPASRKDTAFLFTRIEHARKNEQWKLAKELLLSAPGDPVLLVDPDEWWVERRIVSRKLIEQGDYQSAYRIVANHSAASASDKIEAEFHAGWYALRYIRDRKTARMHFTRLLQHATRPISLARGHYWMARASTGPGVGEHYRKAARHIGTYYGQLAAHELGLKKIALSTPSVSKADRERFSDHELVRAIKRLENTGQSGWANGFYLHLARNLSSPAELALLSARAERRGDFQLSLQIGKIANGRGLNVETLAWPKGAIPGSAGIDADHLALAYAISRQESAFDKAAVSGANARGLMQLLPATAKAVARKNGYTYSRKRLTTDAAYNARLGTAYLNEQMKQFGKSYILTFIAYNAGPRRVGQWIERFGDPRGKSLYSVIDWVEQIPFSETRHYVQRVLENYQIYKARIGGAGLSIVHDLTLGRRR